MQQHVDLIHDQDTGAPRVQHAHQRVGHVAACNESIATSLWIVRVVVVE